MTRRFAVALILTMTGCISSTTPTADQPQTRTIPMNAETPAPPVARREPHPTTLHGETLVDEYYWFRQKSSPEVVQYLEAENAYTAAQMKALEPLQQKLYDEMLGRIKQTDVNVPYRIGDYLYYSRTEEGQQYAIHARRRVGTDTPEEITLDLNELAKGHSYLGLGAYQISDDGNLLAYSLDVTGFRQYTLHVKDLRTGVVLPDVVEKTSSVAWAADGKHLFYTVEDAAKRNYRLLRHEIGSSAVDPVLYEEKDELYGLGLNRSRSRGFLFLTSASSTSSEVRYLAAGEPLGEWKVIEPRSGEHEYYLEHHGDSFYIVTNDKGRNFRLVKAPVNAPSRDRWVEVVPHRPAVKLEGVDAFASHLVLEEREAGLEQLTFIDLRDGSSHRLQFPEPVYSVSPDVNREYDTNVFRMRYQSFVTPQSVYDYDMSARTRTLLKRTDVLGDYDPADYVSERIEAVAADGTHLPISLVYRRTTNPRSVNPTLLYAYGSYGVSIPITFSSNRLSLLDRGMVFALAHIRGGGEMGQQWHDDGKMQRKMNTFTDFITSAEHLIAQGYTSKEKLVIQGGSAGGLLTGAVVNMRPDLFKAVVSQVPFVDVINTMSDPSLPLTVGEYLEWGNPNVEAEYRYIRQYDPYNNIRPVSYPAMLVTTSLNDSQVMYWEATKYVARLRATGKGSNPLLLRVNMGAGHGGASGRYDRLREIANEYAFMLGQLGLDK